MLRVMIAFVLFVFLLVLAVSAWVGANRQLGEAWAACVSEMGVEARLSGTQSVSEVTTLIADTVDCADERKGFLAGLFYGRNAILERYAEKLRLAAIAQQKMEDQLREIEQDRNELLNDYEAERNLEEFRRGAYQGAEH